MLYLMIVGKYPFFDKDSKKVKELIATVAIRNIVKLYLP